MNLAVNGCGNDASDGRTCLHDLSFQGAVEDVSIVGRLVLSEVRPVAVAYRAVEPEPRRGAATEFSRCLPQGEGKHGGAGNEPDDGASCGREAGIKALS